MMFYPLLWVEGLSFWYYLSTYVVFEIIYTLSWCLMKRWRRDDR